MWDLLANRAIWLVTLCFLNLVVTTWLRCLHIDCGRLQKKIAPLTQAFASGSPGNFQEPPREPRWEPWKSYVVNLKKQLEQPHEAVRPFIQRTSRSSEDLTKQWNKESDLLEPRSYVHTYSYFLVSMVYTDYTKQRILSLFWRGCRISKIVMLEDGIQCTKQGVRQFLKCYNLSKSIERKPGSGLPPKLSPQLQQVIEVAMRNNNETTKKQHASNASFYEHLCITCNYILYENRISTYRGSAYHQLIRQKNKIGLGKNSSSWRTQRCDLDYNETSVQIETRKPEASS